MPEFNQIAWTESGTVRILDQTRLPGEETYRELSQPEDMAEAIRTLRVRGAPLIGVAAAMGVALAARRQGGRAARHEDIEEACDTLKATRPTAVNLAWAVERMRKVARSASAAGDGLHAALVAEANAIWEEDRAMCRRIGEAGLPLLPEGALVHTHCNAGALATSGMGTALAPVYLAHEAGRQVSVIADETRPLLQGSRLTAWELGRAGISCTVIADNMAASRLRRGGITCVIVGADRIAANGDVANKIGTYGVALAAREHGVPFYVAAPTSTFDFNSPDGSRIPIEERGAEEIRAVGGHAVAPSGAAVWNPAFDVTPAELVAGYITDKGLRTRDELKGLRTGD
ncbi:MAG TPA: S-methyl-5-thioribose-1-phosphate isomerase [Gemmatimonadales bacterium]|nr:S-methyl-5-thioribose-1-phosphate isomerase [Gemmatimonadales bacterium]